MLTVRDLRKALIGMNPDAPVLVPTKDHQFYYAAVRKETVLATYAAAGICFDRNVPGIRLRSNEFRTKALVLGG